MLEKKNQKQIKMQIFTCPTCNGFGFSVSGAGHHVICDNCKGLDSAYGYFDKQVVYFGKKITLGTIKEEKIKKVIRGIYNGILFALGIGGILLLLWQIYENVEANLNFILVFGMVSWKMILFWLSIIIDCYIYYRIAYDLESRKEIKQREEGDKGPHVGKILNWEKFHKLHKKEKQDISEYFKFEAIEALHGSLEIAEALKKQEVGTMQL
ncbi:MAG: hypothetical protein ABID45_00005, partial [Patescibacteria group bacterium]